tara:strand:- start:1722 stop:2057 length:336 start_codon:yes stop_codon:yes gene_type:complete
MMNETGFILALEKTTKAYSWSVNGKNQLLGVARNGADRGRTFSPLTAVCRYTGNGTFRDTKRGQRSAARNLSVSTTLADNVVNAGKAASNRGNYQVLRGRMKQALGVCAGE